MNISHTATAYGIGCVVVCAEHYVLRAGA